MFPKLLNSLRNIFHRSENEMSHLFPLLANSMYFVPSEMILFCVILVQKRYRMISRRVVVPDLGQMDRFSPFTRSALRDLGLRSASG